MASIALMGPPGSGKSTMACLTAPGPVHVLDIDRKMRAMGVFRKKIESGEITIKEIAETITEGGMAGRLRALVENKETGRPPTGWTNFANYCDTMEKDESARKAKTIFIDSYTLLALHMRSHIQHLRGKGKFVWDDWTVWRAMWMETTTILIDYCLANDKHLIVSIHERVSEKPGQQTGKVMVRNSDQGKVREYVGTMDVKMAGSIDGAFGLEFGAYFTDVYALHVVAEKDKVPVWKCRVKPDAQRDLRCSYDVGDAVEFEPDFRKIMGREWR